MLIDDYTPFRLQYRTLNFENLPVWTFFENNQRKRLEVQIHLSSPTIKPSLDTRLALTIFSPFHNPYQIDDEISQISNLVNSI